MARANKSALEEDCRIHGVARGKMRLDDRELDRDRPLLRRRVEIASASAHLRKLLYDIAEFRSAFVAGARVLAFRPASGSLAALAAAADDAALLVLRLSF